MIKKILSIGLFFGLCCMQGYAQKFDIVKLSTNEGLPSGQIGDVVQSSDGFIWLSTYSGLVRYDGIDTKIITTQHGLRSNLIYGLFIDDENNFWVSTYDTGVGLFDGDSVSYPTQFAPLDTLSITHITQSKDGRLWFSTYGKGLFIWDGDKMENLTEKDGLPSNYTWNIRFLRNGETWIGTLNGVGIYDGDSFQVVNEENGLSGSSAYSFAEDWLGNVWVSTSAGISIFEGDNWRQIRQINGKKLGYIYDVFVDNDGLVWIATERNGIYWFDGDEFTHINKSNGLSSNYIYSFQEDNNGRVWVATDENGVNVFRNKQFRIYDESQYVKGKSVNVIQEGDDGLWLGTDEGITKFNENGSSKHFSLPQNLVHSWEVWDIEKLPNGNFIILNNNSSLLEFDGAQFSDLGAKINLPSLYLQDILVQNDVLWLATESGLVKYAEGTYKTYTTEEGLQDNFVWSLYEDSNGSIWVTTDKGVTNVIKDSLITFSFKDGISGSSMNLITQGPDGTYWVGTDAGFNELVINDEQKLVHTRQFNLAEEFLSDSQFLLFDEAGNLWYGTNGGIHFFHNEKLQNAESGEINGLFFPLQNFGKGIEMNYLAAISDASGDLWFGSYTHGLIKYEMEKLPTTRKAPVPFLRSILVNGKSLNKVFGEVLSHAQNNISIDFGAFQFTDPNRVFYEYRLVGFEDDWNRTYGKTSATYTNLSSGDYTFELRTKGIQSDWGKAASLTSFNIKKPFWQRTWFYALVVFGFMGTVAGGFKVFLIQYEKQKLGRLVKEQTRDLNTALEEKNVLIKEIHHRVKNNMAVISGLLDLQSWHIKDDEAKMALENSKLRIQTMSTIHEKLYQNDNLTNIDFKIFAEDLTSKIAESLKGTNKEIKVHYEITQTNLDVHKAIPCGLILNELICNSFEHAFKDVKTGNIWITFKKYVGKRYCLMVKDDGCGISEELIMQKRSSLGITLINSLASQIKAEVQFLNDNGTTVKIILPQ